MQAREDEGQPRTVPKPKLRRRPFGYKATDVDEALDARDSEIAELRQDVAALWLAFAQHDRMIRTALDPSAAAAPAPEPESQPRPPDPAAPDEESSRPPGPAPETSIGRQLSDLDGVLAAIELATQTLERTYTEEIEEARPGIASSEQADNPDERRGDAPATS